MRVHLIIVCTLVIYSQVFLLISGDELCEDSVRLKLDGAEEADENSTSITHNNTLYEDGTYWRSGDDYFGCPCLIKQCLRLCEREKVKKVNVTVPDEDFMTQIFHNKQNKTVRMHDHFNVLPEKGCREAFMLEPDQYEDDKFVVLSNGSLYFPSLETVQEHHSYCIGNKDDKIVVFSCLSDEEIDESNHIENKPMPIQFYLYPVFMIISIFFLFLTVVSFFVAPEMKNLHGKCIACQSGTLMIAFIALTVTYLAGRDSHIVVCKLFAYTAYIFMLSSFYWLNTMCFDIFWTFSNIKKMTGSLQQTHKKKFKLYALNSTINPLLLFTNMVILDNVLDDKSKLWPGIGAMKCWFRSYKTEFLFYQGPVLFLLVLNVIFFTVTLIKLFRMKKEAQVLKRGDSMTHSGGSGIEDKQRFVLYAKLFLLMGGTWLMEIISWSLGGANWIWIATDLINCSRGVLIFIFCVWTNKKVRASLLSRVSSRYATSEVSGKNNSKIFSSKASATSDMSVSAGDPAGQKFIEQEDTPV